MNNWREAAACSTVDPDLFFPIGSTGPALLQLNEAKAVCQGCAVREECLQWALETGQSIGVWGGTSEAERRTLWRRAAARRSQDSTA